MDNKNKNIDQICVDENRWITLPLNIQLREIAEELARATEAAIEYKRAKRDEAMRCALLRIDATLGDPRWINKNELYELREAVAAMLHDYIHPALSRYIGNVVLKTALHT